MAPRRRWSGLSISGGLPFALIAQPFSHRQPWEKNMSILILKKIMLNKILNKMSFCHIFNLHISM